MANKEYSYQKDWDAIYSKTDKKKPWIGVGVAPYLRDLFSGEEFFASHKEDSILDLGCGDGSFCRFLASKGYEHIKGIDTSKVIIDRCNETSHNCTTISFERKDIIVDDFTGKKYDTVVCWLVLHHIRRQDLGTFIHNLSLLCNRNASVFISFLTSEQEGLDERNSLFSEEHNVIFYGLNDIITCFSQYFDVQDIGQDILKCTDTNVVFPYHILKMRKRRISRDDWVTDLRDFKIRTALPVSYTESYSTLMELLRDFAYYSNKNRVLDIALFNELFQKLFRNVSRYICKRLLHAVDEKKKRDYVVILKLNNHSSGVDFSATQYAEDEDGFRPHCRYMDKESEYVSSRAYDLFLAYDQFLRPDPKRKHRLERFTLQDHFIQDPQLGSFSFSWNEVRRKIVVAPVKEQKYIDQKKDYSAFLKSMFRKPTGENEFERYLNENYHTLFVQDRDFTKAFYCFNLGVPGYESWGTIMIDFYGSDNKPNGQILVPTSAPELFLEIKNLIFILKKIEYDYYETFNSNEIKTQAVKAAIAKAMARNMSHNIGSHVLSNLVKDDIYDELKDVRVKKLNSYVSDRKKDLFLSGKNRQLAFFLRYLKSRMDYMSEVTFGSPSLLVNRMIAGDVMKEFDSVRILLNHISGIPGFRYKLNLKYGDDPLPLRKDDIAVAFPGDVIGCQAFYNIIENVIRNTAKHTMHQSGEKEAVFTIRFMEPENCESVDGSDKLFCVEIWSDVAEDRIDDIVTGQNQRLNSSVLDDFYNLRNHSLGLLEMEASAAFLRQLDLHEIESDDYDVDDSGLPYHEQNGRKRLNIIKAFAVHNGEIDKEGKPRGYLAYRFFVQKPKEFLFVGNWDDVDSVSKNTLLSKGVGFLSFEDFRDLLKKGKPFAHEYLLYDAPVPDGFGFSDYETLLPLKRIPVNGDNRSKLKSFLAGDRIFADLRDFVWSELSERKCHIMRTIPDSLEPETDYVVALRHREVLIYEDGYKARRTLAGGEDHLFVERLSSRTLERMPCYDVLSIKSSYSPSKKSFSLDELETNYFEHFKDFFWKDEDERLYSWIVKEISDAYSCRIVAIDERIQKYAEENKEDDFHCWAFFEMTRVFIPRSPHRDVNGNECPPLDFEKNPISPEDEIYIPLAPEDFSEYREKLERYIENRINDAFLLIHFGILERMYGGDTERIKKVLRTWAEGGEGNAPKARRVVVTSGRGSHSLDLPDSVCFVNLSSVLYAFCESRNKYLMSFLLNQSRRKNNE